MKITILCTFILFSFVFINSCFGIVQDPPQRITSLPDFDAFSELTPQFSGYITVNETSNRRLFYWFVTAQSENPEKLPVQVWMQGGPGCSSMIGLFTEIGPFMTNSDPHASQKLQVNGWSWNKNVNLLFCDSPAGVGFSYSDNRNDYNTDNTKTTNDYYVMLGEFFKLFPEYSSSPLILSGESFAGDYGPLLTQKIIEGENENLSKRLSALMLGNPVLSCSEWTNNGNDIQMDLFYWHAMISYDLHARWKRSGCIGTTLDPPPHCQALVDEATAIVEPFDPDDLYSSDCTGNATLNIDPVTPQCDTYQNRRTAYLNRADVQRAIHAKVGTQWTACANPPQLNYSMPHPWPNMLPLYKEFTQKRPDIRILLYSGDVDIATVPFAYTTTCIHEMNRTITDPWRKWKIDGALAGYTESYEGLMFATVKGAGHETPSFSPRSAWNLHDRFIHRKPI